MAKAKTRKPAAAKAAVHRTAAAKTAAPKGAVAESAKPLASAAKSRKPAPAKTRRAAAPIVARKPAAPAKAVTKAVATKAEPVLEAVAPAATPIADLAPVKPIQEAAAAASDHLAEAVAAAAEPVITIAQEGTVMTATDTIKQNGDAATDRVQALFGDVNSQAQTAIEKGTKLYEEIVALAKGNVEAIVASSRVAAKGAETIGQEAAEYSKSSFERASATFRSFATVKSPSELFKLQGDYARTAFDEIVAESSKLSESILKLAGEIAQPLSTRVAVAAERVKSAAF